MCQLGEALQCLHDKSIEAEHIQKAVEVYLNAGYEDIHLLWILSVQM